MICNIETVSTHNSFHIRSSIFFILILSFTIACSQPEPIKNKTTVDQKEPEKSTVVLNNSGGFIPVKELKDVRIASVHFNFTNSNTFDSIANKYWAVEAFNGDTIINDEDFFALHDKLKLYNLVLIELSAETKFSSGLTTFIKELETITKTIVVVTGSGKNLAYLNNIKSPIIWNKTDNSEIASVLAQVIFGGKAANNHLNATYSGKFKKGSGSTTAKTRLGYSVPEAVSVNSTLLSGIDSIVHAGIAAHSAPAIVVLVAKDGEVIFNKAYGTHTYDGGQETKLTDLFDLASVTKVTATTPVVMRLYDGKVLNLDSPISKYVAVTRNIADKKDIRIKEAMLHEAGYTPYIKFYELLKPSDLSRDSSAAYPTAIADNYFLRANYFNEVMWPVTLNSKVETRGKYVYSDVSMYMMKEVVETATHQKLNDYVLNELYLPLGMQTTGFLPRKRFDRSRIVPTTENDNWVRNMLVQGYVNDPGAAMAGGVEGHAGLFSNANDLAIFYQMLLNKGVYGGSKYYNASTVDLFTSRRSKTSGRGYGYARITEKEEQANKGYPSQQAFGHSGYTGTYVWVDPKYNLVYICLTNRVYPDDNKTYGPSKVNIRAEVLDLVYKSVINIPAVRPK
jgi:CubicO group peptidase (beta-lactamase class C family)